MFKPNRFTATVVAVTSVASLAITEGCGIDDPADYMSGAHNCYSATLGNPSPVSAEDLADGKQSLPSTHSETAIRNAMRTDPDGPHITDLGPYNGMRAVGIILDEEISKEYIENYPGSTGEVQKGDIVSYCIRGTEVYAKRKDDKKHGKPVVKIPPVKLH